MPTNTPIRAPYTVAVSSDPAGTGAEHSYTATERLLVKSFSATLVSDANAANRQVTFTFEDANGNVYARFTAGGTQAASLTRHYTARPGDYAAPAVADNVFVLTLPRDGIFLPAGGKIKTSTTSVQATDNWGVLTLLAERA